jgi:predicted house-cleaning noncanonical NTP pyrophosphatase (MazG superfamily)
MPSSALWTRSLMPGTYPVLHKERPAAMRTHYNKLVRDKIPEIIAGSGRRYSIEVMEVESYRQALLEKLVEEAQEAAASTPGAALLTELADLREVLDAAAAAFGLTADQLSAEQARRRSERGSFAQRIKLLWTE